MSYSYERQRAEVFTESGQKMFLQIRDNAKRLLKLAGSVQCQQLLANVSGDSWLMLACIDRLVELKELKLIPQENCYAQYQVYVAGSLLLD